MADELSAMVGDAVYRRLAAYLDLRATGQRAPPPPRRALTGTWARYGLSRSAVVAVVLGVGIEVVLGGQAPAGVLAVGRRRRTRGTARR